MLKEGLRWKIGDRNNINICGEPWLHGGKKIHFPLLHHGEQHIVKVNDILQENVKAWNHQILQLFFHPANIAAILATSLSDATREDRLVWS